jgi:hypothetical protein
MSAPSNPAPRHRDDLRQTRGGFLALNPADFIADLRAMKPNTRAHGSFWLQYCAPHSAPHCAIAEVLRPRCERVGSVRAAVRAERISTVAPQGAG